MEKNTVYMNTKINALHNEINDLRNRQIVMEVQLAHTLEKTKMHRELREKFWHEFGIWTCMMLGIFFAGIILHLH